MISIKPKTFFKHLAPLLLGGLLVAPQLVSAAALSISQVPLFITIALPPNITVLLDDSGSMTWGHVPDSLGDNGISAVNVVTTSTSSASVVVGSGTVTSTLTPSSNCNHTSHGVCTQYTYSCSTGYTLSGASTGTTSTAPGGDVCQQFTYPYSCPTGYTLSGPTSGTSSSGSGTTCSKTTTTSTYSGFSSVFTPDTWHYKSSTFNPLAYNPAITYSAGYSDTGTQLSTSFTAAYVNPYNTSAGTVNLSTSYQPTVTYDPSTSASTLMNSTNSATESTTDEVDSCNNFDTSGNCNNQFNPQAAFYYTYTPTSTSAVANGCGTHKSGTTTIAATSDDSCYTLVVVSTTSSPSHGDERQNFANWFSFYRTRNLTTNTSANIAFTGLNSSYRVAWRDLNTCSAFNTTSCKGWSSTVYDNRIATFTGTHRTAFFDWLQHYPASGGTPLRGGLQSIGEYYKTSGVSSPYAVNPQVTDLPEYVCRPNYAVIMTDGLWNDSSSPSPAVSNADNTAITLPDGTAYPPTTPSTSHPYSDSSSSSLADIAFYYWSHSLRSDLGTSTSLQYMPYTKNITVTDSHNNTANLIPYWNPQNDPASWPHMVTFTVGLGLTSILTSPTWSGSTYAGGYSNLVTGNVAWPAVSSNSNNNAYDLWHAALDSRGQFFSADSPADVQAAFNTIVNRIQGRVGSSSAIAVNSTRLNSNTFIYQAQFNSSNWTGEVLAFSIGSDGSIATTPSWQASAAGQIPAPASRTVFTWNEGLNSGVGGGTTFLWANLTTAEQTSLNTSLENVVDGNGSLRVSFLRGDQSDEQSQSGGIFRIRANILGDIVDSNPQFVGAQNFGFDSNKGLTAAEYGSYDTFLATKTGHDMLYVGANDGMLHAINAKTGAEQFAYVPRAVYPNLSALSDPLYTHAFFVDGSPTSVDAFVSSAWKTLLVGTTGAGGHDVFLLDITNPFSETVSNVLWDYDGVDSTQAGYLEPANTSFSYKSSSPDPDMGYTINEPTIVRMHDGNWYALFGNGYSSTNQQAALYLYNINTKVLYKYSTATGSSTSPNGMSSPSPVDYDGDRITDAIYAGDLLGNLWKLDVSGSTPSSWKFTTYGGSSPAPLFTAKDASGNVQPITDRPQAGLDSSGRLMLFFGTGTYFLTGDNSVPSTPPVQSFYGIIDDKGNASTDQVKRTASTLLQQYIVTTTSILGNTFRVSTANTMTSSDQGWFMDLVQYSGNVQGTAVGERVVSDAVLDLGRIVFPTLIPEGNACQFGGESFLMEIDASSGAALPASPFDTNGDGLVNNQDMLTNITYTDPTTNKPVTGSVAASGQESNVGIIKTPGIISSGQLQYKYFSGSTGAIGKITESGSSSSSRLSWQQLQ